MDIFHQIPLIYGTCNTLVLIFSNVTNLVPDFFKSNTGGPSAKLLDRKTMCHARGNGHEGKFVKVSCCLRVCLVPWFKTKVW